MARPIPKKFEISEEDRRKINEYRSKKKAEARASALLGKRENPTWKMLMENINKEFSTFEGAPGFYNIYTGEWAFALCDVARGHEFLATVLKDNNILQCDTLEGTLRDFIVPVDWVYFTIGTDSKISVRSSYFSDGHYKDLTEEKRAAINYKLTETVTPVIKKLINEQFPYQDKARIITNSSEFEIDSKYTHRFRSAYNGSFSELVYKLKGMYPLENVTEFEKWLNSDD